MWTGDSAYRKPDKLPLFWQRMREMNVSAGMVHGDMDPQPLLDAKMPYYVENIVNKGLCLKWNSRAADWDKLVTEWKGTRDEAAFVREYCLDDPEWRAWANGEMRRLVQRNAAHAPLCYDIRDELSTTMSANPFDYDFGAPALAGLRAWLKTHYGSLEALDLEWETKFASWDEVRPFTTDQIKNRMASGEALPRGKNDWSALQRIALDPAAPLAPATRWNFAPWCDHRTYMDIALARTLDELRKTAHEVDPNTPVGIEGTQMPSAFGGYDLRRLSRSIDWVEPYDVGDARMILGSFLPGKLFFSTVGEQDARAARRRLWHLLLQGDRGCFVWWSEDCIDWNSADYTLTPRAKALAPVFAELRSPLARLFLRAEREVDRIAIHYSQPSIQVAWLLDSAEDGSTWPRRFSSYEAEHSRHARVRSQCVTDLENQGYTPRFVATDEIEAGELKNVRWLVLPCSYALSDAETLAIRNFSRSAQGGVELRGAAFNGLFDEHGRLRPDRPSLAHDVPARDLHELVPLDVTVTGDKEVRVQRYRLGNARLVALERNIGYRMGEDLKQKSVAARLEQPVEIDLHLATKAWVVDLASGERHGLTDRVHLTLDPWHPALFGLTPSELPAGDAVKLLHEQADAPK